jgi:hypothetical protein
MTENETKYPQIHWRQDGTYHFSIIDNYKSREFILSERDFWLLVRSIGCALERKYRPEELNEWNRRVAC